MRRATLLLLGLACAAQDPVSDLLGTKVERPADREDTLAVRAATRTPVLLGRAPAALTVITREDIARYGYRTLDQALARVAEVHVHDLGHNTDADFRGFFANNTQRRVLYLLDGQPLNDRFHFGDFLPDTVQDLSEIERIEVLRGPGSALYGTSAVLGVVNLVTRGPLDLPLGSRVRGNLSLEAREAGGTLRQASVGYHARWGLRSGLRLSLGTREAAFRHDTGAGGLARPWSSPFQDGGPGWARREETTDVYSDVPGTFQGGTTFARGRTLPDVDLQAQLGDLRLRATLLSHRTSWVWFQSTSTFNHPDNDRSWGTGGLSAEWRPNWSGNLVPSVRMGGVLHTNREITDYAADLFLRDAAGAPTGTSLFSARMHEAHAPLVAVDAGGTPYGLGAGVDPALLTDAEAMRHGGGGRKNYAGVDRTAFLEAQLVAYPTQALELSGGFVLERSVYVNKQWSSFRDGTFIGWLRTGGISDDGEKAALWLQALWDPTPDLSLTAGLRFDHQRIGDVRRQLGGGPTIFEASGTTFVPLARSGMRAQDLSPRLALAWRFAPGRTLRLIYAEAFRAVPPQEVIRLPRSLGEAASEKTRSLEALVASPLPGGAQVSLGVFHVRGNVLYAFQSSGIGFTAGSGWNNTGLTLEGVWRPGGPVEAWANLSLYRLRRPTDALSFMVDHHGTPPFPALPNEPRPLDSPTRLAKAGFSWRLAPETTLALEALAQGPTRSLRPVDLNVGDPLPTDPGQPDALEHQVPGGLRLNLTLRTSLAPLGWPKGFASLSARNLLDAPAWGALPIEAQGWDPKTYGRPMQFRGPGRSFVLQAGWTF